jgi:uncharacterized protein (AIM24 family)
MTDSYRKPTQSEKRNGVTMTAHRYAEKRLITRGIPNPDGVTTQYVAEGTDIYQLEIKLEGGGVLIEPGALQYMHGRIETDVVRHEAGKGFLSRAISSAGTGESAHATRMKGDGTIWCEPGRRHFVIATMDGDKDALLLDDRAFYACSDGISLSVEEIEQIEVKRGEKVTVDGDFMLMYSAGLTVEIGPLVSGIRNAMRSGEGFVYKLSGEGSVWVMPTAKLS